ncbi:hypothetical protein [Marinomonas sp. 2405UD68-3]|uniref:hypothetical protein n=1 Tax=Marinomonas sp. 2405UD68-3 TaxID=3391835 RepID=UPI0039C95BCA
MSAISGASSSYGTEVLSARLAQSAQKQEGQAALKLLESAGATAPAKSTVPQGNLGNSINVHV